MESFGEAFRKARTEKKVTLRELGEHVGKSIGYLSDIEHGRKRPPKLDMVGEIEDFLGIIDARLMKLARKSRMRVPKDLARRIRMRPQLSTLLLRAENLSDEKLEALIIKLEGEGEG